MWWYGSSTVGVIWDCWQSYLWQVTGKHPVRSPIPKSCPFCIQTNLGNYRRTMRHFTHQELLSSCSKNRLLSLDTSIGHLNPLARTLLKISGISYNVLFRRDLYRLALLWICGFTPHSCGICGVNCLQDTFGTLLEFMLRRVVAFLHISGEGRGGGLRDIRKMYQFLWTFSTFYNISVYLVFLRSFPM